MRGTRRTIVASAASLAVVLGVGGVAAATSGNGSRADDPVSGTSTSVTSATVVSAHHQRGTGMGSRHLLGATSTTVADDETSTTVEEATTSTTVEHDTSTTLAPTTPTSVEPDDDKDGDHDAADLEAADHDDADDAARQTGANEGHSGDVSGHHDGARPRGGNDGGSDHGGGSHSGRD
ncbi:MAG: hypothetical protein QOI08_449 [Actinomycetota bacterium]|nr:hypothetical protein [Actinomycetota bacterium]